MREGFFHVNNAEYAVNSKGLMITVHNGETFGFRHDDNTLYIVKSICSKHDVYSKKIGRKQCRSMLDMRCNCDGWNKVMTLQDIKDDIIASDMLLSYAFPILSHDKRVEVVKSIKSIHEFNKVLIQILCETYLTGRGEYMQ